MSRTSSYAPERPPLVKPVETDLSGAADQSGSRYVATAYARPRGVEATEKPDFTRLFGTRRSWAILDSKDEIRVLSDDVRRAGGSEVL